MNSQESTQQATTAQLCPDNIRWCTGLPADHTDLDDHRHQGPEYALTGTYLCDGPGAATAGFQLARWGDSQPHLTFQGTGLWADITLAQVDELIGDATVWLTELIATRRRLAVELNPGRTPFTESGEEQLAAAAVALAHRSVDTALANTGDRGGTLRALHAYLTYDEKD